MNYLLEVSAGKWEPHSLLSVSEFLARSAYKAKFVDGHVADTASYIEEHPIGRVVFYAGWRIVRVEEL